MDMDLDSAGLTHMLGMYHKFENSSWVPTNLLTKGGEEIILTNKTKQDIFFNIDYYGNHTDEEIKEKELDEYEHELKKIRQVFLDRGLPEKKVILFMSLKLRKSIIGHLIKFLQDDDFINNLINELKYTNRADKMLKVLESLLPAFGMVDISVQYSIERGSIFFLGTKQAILENVIKGDAKTRLSNIIRLCDNKKFSAIIIDSASGNQQIANVIHDIENSIIIYCMRLTTQFRRGTTIKLKDFIEKGTHIFGCVNVILLPVALPNREYERQSELANLKTEALDDLQANVANLKSIISSQQNSSVSLHDEFIGNGIPEVESFKWYEKRLADTNQSYEDERQAMEIFNKLGKKIISISNK
jgi:hypothetical protein